MYKLGKLSASLSQPFEEINPKEKFPQSIISEIYAVKGKKKHCKNTFLLN